MLKPAETNRFWKDLNRVRKRGLDVEALKTIVKMLAAEETLPVKNRDYSLTGNWSKHRECHIAPDWLLIYRVEGEWLILERTGSHSDLFR